MQFYFPRPTYIALPIALALWVLEQELSDASWFSGLPFVEIFWGLIAFTLGATVQDFYNPSSWIWENIRHIFALAKIKSLKVEESNEGCTHIKVNVALYFLKHVKSGEVYCTVKYLNLPDHDSFHIFDKKSLSIRKNDILAVPICCVRAVRPNEPPLHSLWGNSIGGTDLQEHDKTIMPNGNCLVTIHIRSGFLRQRLPVRLHFRNENNIREAMIYTEILAPGEWSKN